MRLYSDETDTFKGFEKELMKLILKKYWKTLINIKTN